MHEGNTHFETNENYGYMNLWGVEMTKIQIAVPRVRRAPEALLPLLPKQAGLRTPL